MVVFSSRRVGEGGVQRVVGSNCLTKPHESSSQPRMYEIMISIHVSHFWLFHLLAEKSGLVAVIYGNNQ